MKVSDYNFLNWNQDLLADMNGGSSIHLYENNECLVQYWMWNTWGDDHHAMYGIYEDDGSTLKIVFREFSSENGRTQLDKAIEFETTYTFVGSEVEFTTCPLNAYLTDSSPNSGRHYYYKDFINGISDSEDDGTEPEN